MPPYVEEDGPSVVGGPAEVEGLAVGVVGPLEVGVKSTSEGPPLALVGGRGGGGGIALAGEGFGTCAG